MVSNTDLRLTAFCTKRYSSKFRALFLLSFKNNGTLPFLLCLYIYLN
jgi:hypothetical protein